MHPAYSVIVFTTASGAGYGLLIWLSIMGLAGLAPDRLVRLSTLVLALALVTAGLLSSTLHLGRPARAWRALSQARTSWLSREGVFAIATYVPAMALAWSLYRTGEAQGWFAVAAWLAIAGAVATLWSTGMIYASLPTIRSWHHPLVAPIYVALGVGTSAVLLNLLLVLFDEQRSWSAWGALITVASGGVLKAFYWKTIDTAPRTWTIEAATGLGSLGAVRQLDPPHTQPNYVMREMGYVIARKHAQRLRRLSAALLFVVPILASVLLLAGLPWVARIAIAAASVVATAVGVLVERWLFFAEAEHVSMLYYGKPSA